MADPDWTPKTPDTVRRNVHRLPTPRQWERSIAKGMTTGKKDKSQFDPNLSVAEIVTLELTCIRSGTFHKEHRDTRTYYMRVGRKIGYSNGKNAEWIYVFLTRTGSYHGHPTDPDDLRDRKGIRLP